MQEIQMINFILYLLQVSLVYILAFIFFSTIKSINRFTDRTIFCATCVTFGAVFIGDLFYFFMKGVQLIPIIYLFGISLTGIAYRLNFVTDRLRNKIEKLQMKSSNSFTMELIYNSRLFLFTLGLTLLGLVFLYILGGGR